MATTESNITGYDDSNLNCYELIDASNAYNSSLNTQYASVNLNKGSRAISYIFWKFSIPTIPAGATIDSIVCNYKACMSTATTRYVGVAEVQMGCGTTLKGTAQSILTTTATESTISSPGTWTVDEINNGVTLRTYAKRGTSSHQSDFYIYVYGADITITYTEAATGNKVYIKANGVWHEAQDIQVKHNGNWVSVGDVYKKVNGSWEQQSDKSAIFDDTKAYINDD